MKLSGLPALFCGLFLGLPLSGTELLPVPAKEDAAPLISEEQLLYPLPKTESGEYILRCVDRHGPKAVLRTAYFVEPPYIIRAVCRTTDTNVRFTLLDGEIIFNWERNPNDLRLDLPIRSRKNGIADGNIGRNRQVTIELQVFRHSIGIFVDGKLRHVAKGELNGIRSTVGLYTRAGSTVYVREFSVKHPGESAEAALKAAEAEEQNTLLRRFREAESHTSTSRP